MPNCSKFQRLRTRSGFLFLQLTHQSLGAIKISALEQDCFNKSGSYTTCSFNPFSSLTIHRSRSQLSRFGAAVEAAPSDQALSQISLMNLFRAGYSSCNLFSLVFMAIARPFSEIKISGTDCPPAINGSSASTARPARRILDFNKVRIVSPLAAINKKPVGCSPTRPGGDTASTQDEI